MSTRCRISPTDSTPAKVQRGQRIGTYRPAPVEHQGRAETLYQRAKGTKTVNAAHSAMQRAERDFLLALRCYIDSESWGRVSTATFEIDALLSRRPILSIEDALRRKSAKDGAEDGGLTDLALDLTNEVLAKSVYRQVLSERTATDDLLASMCATYGWRA